MNLLIALIVAAIGFYLYEDVSQVPFAELTLNMVGKTGLSFIIFYGAVKFLLLSFDEDRIWKVEWSISYFKHLFASIVLVICVPYSLYGAYQWFWGGDGSDFNVIATFISIISSGIAYEYLDSEIRTKIDN